MGNPVSPTVVNLYIEELEQKIIFTAPSACKCRKKRYVDDILCRTITKPWDKNYALCTQKEYALSCPVPSLARW